MATYVLRDVPADAWDPFQERAKREGWQTKHLIEQLLRDYGAGRLSPSRPPSAVPVAGWVRGRMPTRPGDVVVTPTATPGSFWLWIVHTEWQQTLTPGQARMAVTGITHAKATALDQAGAEHRVFLLDEARRIWEEWR